MQLLFRQFAFILLTTLMATAIVAQERPKVVAVNYPLQYLAQRLMGDYADVVFPVPADVDPSYWRPSISDISMIQSSDLILLNGAGFATWADRVTLPRSRLVNTSADIEDQYIVTESVTHSHGEGGEHSHEALASYLWLDPSLALAQAEAIANAVIQRDLLPASEVKGRLEDLRAELSNLDQKNRSALPDASNTGIIATHPRYQYLGRAYDLSIVSLEWEAGADPSAAQLVELRTLKEQTNADVIIWEAEPPASAIEAANAIGLKSVVFPTLVQRPKDESFADAYENAILMLSKAIQNTSN